VQLFTKSASNWVFLQQLTEQFPVLNNYFGSGVIFSPDGSTLAVNEIYGDTPTADFVGLVHLFIESNGEWSSNQILFSNKIHSYNGFGGDFEKNTVNFSPDSNTLAIGESGAENVQFFTRSGTNWSRGQVLTVVNIFVGSEFGKQVSFSADGNTLAVGAPGARSNGIFSAGNVYLFSKSGIDWILYRSVSALAPEGGFPFGTTLTFNPVGNELAIYDYNSSTAVAKYPGSVSIIDLSKLP